jgi:hypothetical protein
MSSSATPEVELKGRLASNAGHEAPSVLDGLKERIALEKSPRQDASYFLEAPPTWIPHRPLSPDAMSNLSMDEFDQLRPRSRSSYHVSPTDSTHPKTLQRSDCRSRLKAIWIRNLGLVYMLMAQVFGTLMNVTTRLLEIEGNKGKGLNPFQVCLCFI